MATHSSVLAWRIPGTGEPGGLPSMGSHTVGHDWSDLAAAALWCPLATPTVLLGFLLPWMWGISSWLLQQSTTPAPYLGRGHPSWPWTWSISSWPSCTRAAAAPRMWGCSSQPPPLTSDSVQFSRSVVSDSLRPHESQHARPPCPSPTPGVHPDSRPLSQWCHPAISSSVIPFSSCPQSLPASESFPMSRPRIGCSKSSSKREVYSNAILPQETRKTSNRQPKFTPKTTGKRTKNPQN